MNIVVVSDNGSINGGAGKIAVSSAIGMARRGHRVHFLCATEPIDESLQRASGVEVICTRQFEILSDPSRFRAFSQGLWNTRARSAMRGLLDRLRPVDTVVHLHLWGRALSSSVMREAVRRGFPVACTLHDYLLACPTGTLFHHKTQKICTRKPMSPACVFSNCDCRNYGHKLWRLGRFAIQTSLGKIPSGIGNFIAVSELNRQLMRHSIPEKARMELISNFIEVPRRTPVEVEKNDSFVFSGRLVREKGPHLFAECARRINAPAVFVGDGPLRAEVQRILPDARITGWLDHEGVLRELRKARALVFPSLWYEALGLVVLEAAAAGVPSVVPDSCAAREMVEDGTTGLWFRGGDAGDLEAKLRLLQDPETAARLGRGAYSRYWASPPTLELHLDRLETLYGQMLGRVGEPVHMHL